MNSQSAGRRRSKILTAFELAVVAGLFWADVRGLIPFSKTPFLAAAVALFVWLRRAGWQSLGFRVCRNWPLTILLGVLAGAAIEAIELFVSQPFLVSALHKAPDLSDFAAMRTHAARGPAVVWLRPGNVTNDALIAAIVAALPEIAAAIKAGERLVEVQ